VKCTPVKWLKKRFRCPSASASGSVFTLSRQDEYLTIVAQWLSSFGVGPDAIAAAKPASLVWALERGSRSGRVAYQFARDYAGRDSASRPVAAPAIAAYERPGAAAHPIAS
jgi:hypothetical protein